MRHTFTISLVALASFLLIFAPKILMKFDIAIINNAFLNGFIKYQIFALLIASVVLLITLKYTPESKAILSFGNLDTLANKEQWMGINGTTSWKTNGLQLLFFISLATGIFMFLAVKYTNNLYNFQLYFIPYILLFAFFNALSEEIIYRVAINGNLMQYIPKFTVLLTSAILFGLPHYQGYPNGVAGVLMAGVLGYVLSKATYETQGIGLAFIIHFIQDIIIFTALLMMNIK